MDKPTSIPGIGYSGRPYASQHDTPTSGPIVSPGIAEKRGGAAFENQRFDFWEDLVRGLVPHLVGVMILVLYVKMLKCSERIGIDSWNWIKMSQVF